MYLISPLPEYNNTTSESNSKFDSYLSRPFSFRGDVKQFFWWKNNLYSHVISIDEELRDVIQGSSSISVNTDGVKPRIVFYIYLLKSPSVFHILESLIE